MKRTKRPLTERFWEKVTVASPDECWVWHAGTDNHGYGKIRGEEGEVLKAHRVSYEYAYGPIGDNLCVLHKCDNPPCVNPRHLRLGTQADNLRDMFAKGRARQGPKGHPSFRGGSKPKLNEQKVREIRRLLRDGLTQREIMERFDVSSGTISRINTRQAWSWVEDEVTDD